MPSNPPSKASLFLKKNYISKINYKYTWKNVTHSIYLYIIVQAMKAVCLVCNVIGSYTVNLADLRVVQNSLSSVRNSYGSYGCHNLCDWR